MIWWILLGLWVGLNLGFIWCLCVVAARADRRAERIWRERR